MSRENQLPSVTKIGMNVLEITELLLMVLIYLEAKI